MRGFTSWSRVDYVTNNAESNSGTREACLTHGVASEIVFRFFQRGGLWMSLAASAAVKSRNGVRSLSAWKEVGVSTVILRRLISLAKKFR